MADPLAVFDIDGVLADVAHRLHWIEGRPKEWGNFFAEMGADPVLEDGRSLVCECIERGVDVAYLTGRPEAHRQATEEWLQAGKFPAGQLTMRRATDRRPATAYKTERVAELAKRHAVVLVVDDDAAVIRALRQKGWPAQLADWAPAPVALLEEQERSGGT